MKPAGAYAFLATYNIVQNTLLKRRGYVPGNLVATGLGLGWARRSGIAWADMGLSPPSARMGLLTGSTTAVAAASLAFMLRDREELLAMLDDQTLDDIDDHDVWFRVLVRFPAGTGLFEEVWFRGVLPAALRRYGMKQPELAAAAAFAAWHLIPTAAAIRANSQGRKLSARRKAILVVAGSVGAGVAGLGFTALRRTSGSLVAPWIAHAALNGAAFLLALRSRRAKH